MKLLINFFLFLLPFLMLENKVLSLNEYQIREICSKKKMQYSCVKKLRDKKLNLLEGNRIEIEVIPYKRELKY